MQRRVPEGSVSFNQNWAAYRDGFGPATGNDNYWLGLDKVYYLVQLGSVRLRVQVDKIFRLTSDVADVHSLSLFSVSLITPIIKFKRM